MKNYFVYHAVIGLALLIPLCVYDIRYNRIPDAITLPAAVAGILVSFLVPGWHGFAGALVGVWMVLIPFMLGLMGGGDLKMALAFGAIAGPDPAAAANFFGSLVGALVITVFMIFKGQFKELLLGHIRWIKSKGKEVGTMKKFPFAPYYLSGAVIYYVLMIAGGRW